MPRNGPIFQDHHAIEQQTLERSQLLRGFRTRDILIFMPPRIAFFCLQIPRLLRLWGPRRIAVDPSLITRMG